jgi:hypothetical protein
MKAALQESKQTNILVECMMADKITELRSLRQNIVQLSPKTCSSHSSDLVEMPDIDYNDPESFQKAQLLLEKKQKERDFKRQKTEELKNQETK